MTYIRPTVGIPSKSSPTPVVAGTAAGARVGVEGEGTGAGGVGAVTGAEGLRLERVVRAGHIAVGADLGDPLQAQLL
ncbi:hypothetical protein, partial [Streptomyces sp. NPDC048551]|uniref:hypothetical protein n=1 Tax=Streptomyces sp. NPDC048551 TaxID=3155758 RepID=UPI00343B3869